MFTGVTVFNVTALNVTVSETNVPLGQFVLSVSQYLMQLLKKKFIDCLNKADY